MHLRKIAPKALTPKQRQTEPNTSGSQEPNSACGKCNAARPTEVGVGRPWKLAAHGQQPNLQEVIEFREAFRKIAKGDAAAIAELLQCESQQIAGLTEDGAGLKTALRMKWPGFTMEMEPFATKEWSRPRGGNCAPCYWAHLKAGRTPDEWFDLGRLAA